MGTEGIEYVVLGNELTITSFPRDKEIIFPTVIEGQNVTHLGKGLLQHCLMLKSVTIPEGIKVIRSRAFRKCSNLQKIGIPISVIDIGRAAFMGCSALQHITAIGNIEQIRSDTFRDCINLRNVNIPKSVTKIGTRAFCNCQELEKITIPNSVTKIGCDAFNNCWKLESVVIPNSVEEIGTGAFKNCSNLKKVNIPMKFKPKMDTPMDSVWKDMDPILIEFFSKILSESSLVRSFYFNDKTILEYY